MKKGNCHEVAIRNVLRVYIPGLKALSLSKRPFLEFNCIGLPTIVKSEKNGFDIKKLELAGGKLVCLNCGKEIHSVYSVFRFNPSRWVAKIAFWSALTIRQHTSNTRLGSVLVLTRSILNLVFLASILIFAQASNESRPIWFILYNFGLWVLFEVGIIRSALVLNTFKDLRRDLKASSLLVSSAAYLSNLFDFFPIALIIFSYSLFISDMSVRSWLFTALAFLSAYLVLFLPALLLSFGAAWLNRNHRDFKHILPWIIRIFIFTTPIFDIGYSGHFMTVQSILEFSPLSFPFNVLQMPVEGVQAIEPQMIIGFILTSLALLLVYKDRATRE